MQKNTLSKEIPPKKHKSILNSLNSMIIQNNLQKEINNFIDIRYRDLENRNVYLQNKNVELEQMNEVLINILEEKLTNNTEEIETAIHDEDGAIKNVNNSENSHIDNSIKDTENLKLHDLFNKLKDGKMKNDVLKANFKPSFISHYKSEITKLQNELLSIKKHQKNHNVDLEEENTKLVGEIINQKKRFIEELRKLKEGFDSEYRAKKQKIDEESKENAKNDNEKYNSTCNMTIIADLKMQIENALTAFEERKHAALYHKRNAIKYLAQIENLNKKIREYENIDKNDIENLRKLLRCAACDKNYKDSALLRCMHVFCKECIDERVRTRQRNCPTCGENFCMAEVKKIYL